MMTDAVIEDLLDETVDIGKTMQPLEAYIEYCHGSKASTGLCLPQSISSSGFASS